MGWFIRPLAIFLLLGAVTHCGAEPAVSIVVCGRRLTGDAAPYFSGLTLLAPVARCAQLAGAESTQSGDTLTLVSATGQTVRLIAGSKKMTVGDTVVQLPLVALKRNGVIYSPISAVLEALGCRVAWSKASRTLYANGVLLDVAVLAGPAGAAVRLRTSTPIAPSAEFLDGPPRYYVDLRGITAPAGDELRHIFTGRLMRVRTGQGGDGIKSVRVVADVTDKLGARWDAHSPISGALILGRQSDELLPVERNFPRITGVSCRQPAAGQERLQVTLDWPVEAGWDLEVGPPRITLSFPEVVNRAGNSDLPINGEFVDRVTVHTQQSPPSTTVTAYLKELIQFDVRRVEGGGADILFRRERLSDKCVVLDPGHGGRDDGARGKVLKEKDVNLDVAVRASRRLQELGAKAYLTRSDDTFVDLHDRPRAARQVGADMFVSIHCNAMPKRNQGVGTETFYHWRESKCLAYLTQTALVNCLKRPDRGVKHARFVVIREAKMPAILAELLFLNSDKEEAMLQQDETREAAAFAIVEGLRQYVEGSGTAPRELEGGAGLTRLGALPEAASPVF